MTSILKGNLDGDKKKIVQASEQCEVTQLKTYAVSGLASLYGCSLYRVS